MGGVVGGIVFGLGEFGALGLGLRVLLPVPSSQFPVPSSQFPVPSSQFPVPSSQFLVPSSWFPVLGSQFPVLGSWPSVLRGWLAGTRHRPNSASHSDALTESEQASRSGRYR